MPAPLESLKPAQQAIKVFGHSPYILKYFSSERILQGIEAPGYLEPEILAWNQERCYTIYTMLWGQFLSHWQDCMIPLRQRILEPLANTNNTEQWAILSEKVWLCNVGRQLTEFRHMKIQNIFGLSMGPGMKQCIRHLQLQNCILPVQLQTEDKNYTAGLDLSPHWEERVKGLKGEGGGLWPCMCESQRSPVRDASCGENSCHLEKTHSVQATYCAWFVIVSAMLDDSPRQNT